MVRSPGVRRRIQAALLVALTGGLWLAGGTPAQAADAIDTYTAVVKVEADGTLQVTATLTAAEGFPDTLTQRFATSERLVDNQERLYDITDVTAKSEDADLKPSVKRDGDYEVVEIDSGDATGPITLSYTVDGAAEGESNDTTVVSWRVLQGLSASVQKVAITIEGAGAVMEVACVSGPPSSPSTCSSFQGGTHDAPNPIFNDGPRGAGEIVQPTVRYPTSEVAANENIKQLWTLDRAFGAGWLQLLAVFFVLVVGGGVVYALHRRIGRDINTAQDPTVVASFRPVGPGESDFVVADGVRPGMVGTLLDERVDPVDVTASVLDLAVRGHLHITELPRESEYAPTDWMFTRKDGPDDLSPYEISLLDTIAPVDSRTQVSTMGPAVLAAVPLIQSELYDEVVERGWYAQRPDDIRNKWARIAWIAVGASIVATIGLVAFTTFGLAGLGLIAVAVGLLFVAREMPSRTAAGTSVLAGLQALQADLMTHPTHEAPRGREYELFSRVLPYAVVLGGQDRWLAAIVEADDDVGTADPTDLSWYHAPDTWHLQDLPGSLKNFLTTLQGTLFSR